MWAWHVKMLTQKLVEVVHELNCSCKEPPISFSFEWNWSCKELPIQWQDRLISWTLGLVIKLNFFLTLSTRFGQDFDVEVQARFLSRSLVSILQLMFVRGYEVESWFEILKLGFVNILNFKFIRDTDIWLRFEVCYSSRFWRWNLIKICVRACDLTH